VALNNLGAALQQQGRLGEAAGAYRAALAVSPSYPEALCNLAAVLADLRQLDEADAVCAQALAAAPSMAKAQNVLGVVRRDQGRLDEAVAAFRAAIALAPAEPDPYVNLGDALAAQGQADQQVALCAQAAALAPDSARAQNNLGTALYMAGRLPEATGCFRRATQLQPEGAEGHFHLGMALLAAGDMAAGWREYEWRWRTPLLAPARRGFAQPVWDGRTCGKTLLIHAEQGFGDTLQFCRYAPLAAARGLRVILEVPGVLAELLGGLPGVAQVVARGDALPAFDVHAPMLSLPYIFGTVLETVPGTVAYLAADAQAAAAMAARLGRTGKTGLRAGIVWAGNSYREAAGMAAVDRRRSIAPDRLAPLLDVPGVHFVSLQKDRPAPAAFGLTDFMDDIGDFAGTAALVDNLDLVIAVDTAVAHLAGALGKPVWLLNRYDSEWRWMLGRADSPWYPTMRIFRQAGPGDWDGVIEEVARALAMTV
jgi:Flp pilus assembly protein TadD